MSRSLPTWDDFFKGSMLDRGRQEVVELFDWSLNGGLFNDLFSGGSLGRRPTITDDELARHYDFEVPGATKDSLKADLDGNVLTIQYTTKTNRGTRSGQYIYVLPRDVDLEDDPAVSLEDGVCTVTVSLREPEVTSLPTRRNLPVI